MLILKSGRIVTEDGILDGDLVVENGKIAAITKPGGFKKDGGPAIDCAGQYILPGAVDVHVHANDPGRTDREDFYSLTAAAAAGGVTAVVDMPIDSLPPTVDGDAFARKLASARSKCVVDFAFWGGLVNDNVAAMADMRRRGASGFKAFMVDVGEEFPFVDDDVLRRGMREAAALGCPVLVHAESEALRAVAAKNGGGGLASFLREHSVEVENAAVKTAIRLAREEGCRPHVCHASNAGAVELVAEAKRSGQAAGVETAMHYLVFSDGDLAERPNLLKCAPPLRSAAERESLWRALLAGDIDLIASDHSPCLPEEKDAGVSVRDAWAGINGVQATLQLLFHEGVAKRGLPVRRLAELTAANPARLAGLYPRKGVIRVGADADLALLDPDREWRWSERNWLGKRKNTPYLGMSGKGLVTRTLVRGETVFDGDGICVERGFGRFLGM